jgi:hypothetical protein
MPILPQIAVACTPLGHVAGGVAARVAAHAARCVRCRTVLAAIAP